MFSLTNDVLGKILTKIKPQMPRNRGITLAMSWNSEIYHFLRCFFYNFAVFTQNRYTFKFPNQNYFVFA